MRDREKEMTTQKHQTAFISRVRFSRDGSLTFTGHLDMMRTFERSIRRAGLPLLHSQGYNPRPVLVFALPLGVGIATTDDYVDIYLSEEISPETVLHALAPVLPPDLCVISAVNLPEAVGSIMAMVSAAQYTFYSEGIAEAVKNLLLCDEILVEKNSKGQTRTIDIRPLILSISDSTKKDCPDSAVITVRAGSSENLRPDLFLKALEKYADYPSDLSANTRIVRTGLYHGKYPDLKRFTEEN